MDSASPLARFHCTPMVTLYTNCEMNDLATTQGKQGRLIPCAW